MSDIFLDKNTIDVDCNPPDGQSRQRNIEHHSSEDATSPDQAALDTRPDALAGPTVDAQQGARKSAPASQRRKEAAALRSQVNSLKTHLAIDDEYCGATTREGAACRMPTPAKGAGVIITTLQRLITMTQSSEELDGTLESLVGIVHCHHHSCGTPSKARVEKWVDTFPRGPKFGRSRIVLARKMRKVLGTISIHCAGRKRSGEPCQARIGGQKVRDCQRTIDELVEADNHPHRAVWELLLCVLERNRYCGSHYSQASMQNIRQWLTELWAYARPRSLVSSLPVTGLRSWSTQCTSHSPCRERLRACKTRSTRCCRAKAGPIKHSPRIHCPG